MATRMWRDSSRPRAVGHASVSVGHQGRLHWRFDQRGKEAESHSGVEAAPVDGVDQARGQPGLLAPLWGPARSTCCSSCLCTWVGCASAAGCRFLTQLCLNPNTQPALQRSHPAASAAEFSRAAAPRPAWSALASALSPLPLAPRFCPFSR